MAWCGGCLRATPSELMAYTNLERRRFKARERWAAGKRPPSKKSPEYRAWHHMKMRCLNPKDSYFHCYGGRGITVCDEWLQSFSQFLLDMGHRPSARHSLERVNNDDGYRPSNCVWALPKDQSRNRRVNRWLTHNGETVLLVDWALRLRIRPSVICTRLARGWSIDRTLSSPKCERNQSQPVREAEKSTDNKKKC